jgi:hypothetical protein
MPKSPKILIIVLKLNGLVELIENGTVIPIIKIKEGKIKSAGDKPSHLA